MELRYWIIFLALILTEVSSHHDIDHPHNVTENLLETKLEDNTPEHKNEISSHNDDSISSTVDQTSSQHLVNSGLLTDLKDSVSVNEVKGTNEVLPSGSKDKDHLATAESRKRSKIEIKEVNGTLYEYEYIYYYDDDYPLYDYDTPGGDNSTMSKSNITEELKTVEKELPSTVTESTTSTTSDLPAVSLSSRSRSRQRTQNTLEGKLSNEIPTQSLSHSSRQKSRSSDLPVRSRGDSRAVAIDNIAEENIVKDLQIENEKLPAQTRFPPRSTTPSLEIVNDSPIPESDNIIQNIEPNKRAHLPSEQSAINLYAFSKVEDNKFVESSTQSKDYDYATESPSYFDTLYDELTPKELEEIELLTTVDNTKDIEDATMIPQERTLEEELLHSGFTDFPTEVYTANEVVTTEIPTTTTTTTTPATTTTTTTTTTTETTTTTTTESPNFRRSFRGRGRFPQTNRGTSLGIATNDISSNSEAKDPESQASEGAASPSSSLHNRRRPGRINLSGRLAQVGTEPSDQVTANEQSDSKPDIADNVKNRRRLGLPRNRPAIKNHNQHKPTTETALDTDTATEETSDGISRSNVSPPSRTTNISHRRPSPKNRLANRINIKTTPSDVTESTDNAAAEQVDKEPISEGDLVIKDAHDGQDSLPAQTDQKDIRKDINRNHRFNIGNRRKLGNRREKTLIEEEKIHSEAATTTAKISTTQEAAADITENKPGTDEANPSANRSFRRNNNRNLNRFNHRFRNRGNGNAKPEEIEAEVSAVTESKQNVATEKPEKIVTNVESHAENTAEKASKFSNVYAGNRGGERRRTIPGRRQRPLTAQAKDETLPSEAIQEEPTQKPSDPLVGTEEIKINAEDTSVVSNPEDEAAIPTEDVTEVSVSDVTTEKLTRRQMLARRRNRFLNG